MQIQQSFSTLQLKHREVKIINGVPVEYSDVVVYKFIIGDVSDPEIYINYKLSEWARSEAGQWVLSNAEKEPQYTTQVNIDYYGHDCFIVARLSKPNQTFFKLKFQ